MNALRSWAERNGRGYPDWALRYLPVVKRLRPWLDSPGNVLEIGANANGVARFAARPVICVDISLQSLRECRANPHAMPVRADITALPFADHTMQACVCIDTFEHLPHDIRNPAAREILRVLRPDGAAVIGFPAGHAAVRAEQSIRSAYRSHTGGTIRWLEEHAEHGLPDADAIAATLQNIVPPSHTIDREKNTNLRVWQWTWLVLMCGWPGRGNSIAQAALRFATPLLARIHAGACYRAIFYILPRRHDP